MSAETFGIATLITLGMGAVLVCGLRAVNSWLRKA